VSTRPKRRPHWQPRIPITSAEVPNVFGWQMHVSLAALRMSPTREHFDGVARCLNVVQLALESKPKLADLALRINAGARALNQIAAKVEAIDDGAAIPLREHELQPIELAVTAADEAIPRLSVTELNDARLRLQAISAAERRREAA
jgi:hypothetical protein